MNRTRTARLAGAALVFASAPLLLPNAAFAAPDENQGGSAVVGFEIVGDTLQVNSTKDLSNIIVKYCDATLGTNGYAKFEIEDETKTWDLELPPLVDGIWVHSGNNHDPEGPLPAEFNNGKSVGEWLDVSDCSETQTETESTTTTTTVVETETTTTTTEVQTQVEVEAEIEFAEEEVEVLAEVQAQPETVLAYTGSDSLPRTAAGAALLAMGAALMAEARRRRGLITEA
jgi:hypothetical protein